MLVPRALVRFSLETFNYLWSHDREGGSTMALKFVISLGGTVFTEVYGCVGFVVYLRDQVVGMFLDLGLYGFSLFESIV